MLGWGVLVGPIYFAVSLVQAFSRDGFDFSEHQLSLLMLGDRGWIQSANLIINGLLTLAAAGGFLRAMQTRRRGRLAPGLLGVFAIGLVGSGIFAPDPMQGFPPGTGEVTITSSGILHMAFGAAQFLALAGACFSFARWLDLHGDPGWRRWSTASGVTIIVGFLGGAALAQHTIGVVFLWAAVVTGYLWIALASAKLWSATPHPAVSPSRQTSSR
ncbi:DUF998 domain-containing protein [Kribbella sp. NBC_00359]|uniref:DUF998 domain-containing protein n=1 Tax=Kribbella sp. NBC_00359 TaxID=2975966 RepID=UPI002E203F34